LTRFRVEGYHLPVMGSVSVRRAATPLVTILIVLAFLLVPSRQEGAADLRARGQTPGSLSAEDKAELGEAMRLTGSLGSRVWPGLEKAGIPIVLYDEASEFLVGLADPGPGWTAVEGDDFEGRPYFRRPASRSQAFAVRLNGAWAASMSTLGWMNRRGPMKLAPGFHLALLLHEMFHAFQAIQAQERFEQALKVYAAEADYPFEEPDFVDAWNKEGALLAAALNAPDEAGARRAAGDFLEARRLRRLRSSLKPDHLAFERELEWLEGLGKYAEGRFSELAATAAGGRDDASPAPADPFKRMDAARLGTQLGRQKGDLRFYLSGSAQARLLDRLDPGWKRESPLAQLYLEDALRAVVPRQAKVRPERLLSVLEELGEIGKTPDGGVDRVAFSEADLKGRAFFMKRMEEAGLAVTIDAAGNIVGRREGSVKGIPPIVIGSHLDSVPNGGRYDGALGAAAGLECAAVLKEAGALLRHPLEIIIFTDEEGGLIGSKALVGELEAKALEIRTQAGISVREGIIAVGGDPSRLGEIARGKGAIAAYLEIHIEQGGVLDGKRIPIGVVEGIVGIARWEVAIDGFANHAGTTPMDRRHDALLAAAHLIAAVNRAVTERPGRQVGTVGRIRVEPGAVNVIPGRAGMSLELRDLDADKIHGIFERIEEEAGKIAVNTGTKIGFTAIEERTLPALTDERIRAVIEEAAEELGLASLRLPSGAGHDAQSIARIAPIGMIFIPSAGGISHSPLEFSSPEDVRDGASVLLETLLRIDRIF